MAFHFLFSWFDFSFSLVQTYDRFYSRVNKIVTSLLFCHGTSRIFLCNAFLLIFSLAIFKVIFSPLQPVAHSFDDPLMNFLVSPFHIIKAMLIYKY